MIDNRDDWLNRPVKNGLTVKEKDWLLELHEARALERQREQAEQFATLLHLGQLLRERGGVG